MISQLEKILAVLLLTLYKSNKGLFVLNESMIKHRYPLTLAVVQRRFLPSLTQILSSLLHQYPPCGFFLVADAGCCIRSGKSNHLKKKLSTCILQPQLYDSIPSFSQALAIEPVQETAEPTGKKDTTCTVKSLPAQLLDWLTVDLIGARAKGKCGNVAKGEGMYP